MLEVLVLTFCNLTLVMVLLMNLKPGNTNSRSSSSNDNNDTASSIGKISCYAFSASVLVFGVMVLGFFVPSWLNPDRPILEFQIDSVEVTTMRLRNDSNEYGHYSVVRHQKILSADLDFTLTLKNKDEYLLYCNAMQLSLGYHHGDEVLSSTELKPYVLFEDQRKLQFGMQIKGDSLREETVDSISEDFWGQNVLQFALKGEGQCVRWHATNPKKCRMNLLCDDIKVTFSPAHNMTNGSMIVSPLPCEFNSECHPVGY